MAKITSLINTLHLLFHSSSPRKKYSTKGRRCSDDVTKISLRFHVTSLHSCSQAILKLWRGWASLGDTCSEFWPPVPPSWMVWENDAVQSFFIKPAPNIKPFWWKGDSVLRCSTPEPHWHWKLTPFWNPEPPLHLMKYRSCGHKHKAAAVATFSSDPDTEQVAVTPSPQPKKQLFTI